MSVFQSLPELSREPGCFSQLMLHAKGPRSYSSRKPFRKFHLSGYIIRFLPDPYYVQVEPGSSGD